MKKQTLYTLALGMLLIGAASSCEDALDKEVDLSLSADQVFSKYDNTRGFLANIYTYLPDAFYGFNCGDGGQYQAAFRDCMTDNSSSYWPVHYYHSVQSDTYDAKNHYYADRYWNLDFKGIRACNQFMQNAKESVVGNAEKAGDDNHLYNRWIAEARLIRALLQFDLVCWFGDVPLVGDEIYASSGVNVGRTSAAEVLKWVADECDAVKDVLPFRYANEDENWGRVNGAAAYALKSRALLYLASPLNNPSGNKTLWQNAANAATDFISKNASQRNPYALYSTGDTQNDYYNCFVTTPHLNNEYILSRSEWSTFDIERYSAPCGFTGTAVSVGRTNPSLNLVMAYEMSNGLAYDAAGSGYDANDPYANRDPRFENTIFHENSVWGNADQDEQRTVDVASSPAAGQDYQGTHGGTYTGFYCKKFVVNISWNVPSSSPRACPIFRYGEILLNAAEAINEVSGPDQAYQYVDQVRARVGMPSWKTSYGSLSQAQFRERIQNERRVELAFEDHRFFDERRWKLFEGKTAASEVSEPYYKQVYNFYGHEITTTGEYDKDGLTYHDFTVSVIRHPMHNVRVFNSPKNYYFPIPYSEVKAVPALGQNPGWEL